MTAATATAYATRELWLNLFAISPRLDLINTPKPDERAIMTYVSCYYHAFQGAQQVGHPNYNHDQQHTIQYHEPQQTMTTQPPPNKYRNVTKSFPPHCVQPRVAPPSHAADAVAQKSKLPVCRVNVCTCPDSPGLCDARCGWQLGTSPD